MNLGTKNKVKVEGGMASMTDLVWATRCPAVQWINPWNSKTLKNWQPRR